LIWYDLFAPVGSVRQAWSFDDARAIIIAQFGSYSNRMGEFAARAFRENWIDAEPRPDKRDGAFWMSLRRDESRVLANYQPGFKSVLTLAETASIFLEHFLHVKQGCVSNLFYRFVSCPVNSYYF
jgi:oligoendopeptidase F